jgi:hypothetical protein
LLNPVQSLGKLGHSMGILGVLKTLGLPNIDIHLAEFESLGCGKG